MTNLELIMRDGEVIGDDGEGIVIGSKIVDLVNLTSLVLDFRSNNIS